MHRHLIPTFLALVVFATGLLAASPAEAAIVFANTGGQIGGGQNNSSVQSGTFDTSSVTSSNNRLNSVDGNMSLNLDPSTGTNVFRFRFSWHQNGPSDASNIIGDIALRIYTGNVGSNITVTILNLVYENGSGVTGAFNGLNHVIMAGSNSVETVDVVPSSAVFSGGFATDFSVFTHTYLDLQFTGGSSGNNSSTDGFQIDAISSFPVATPEPGTWALFGLGVLGMAGLVRRRRKRRATASSV